MCRMSPESTSKQKKKPRPKWLFLVNFVLFMIPVTYFGYRPLLRYSANVIIAESEPNKADAIVLLSGGEPGRAWGAADLYNGKMAPRIVLTREPLGSDTVELRKLGIDLTTGLDMNTRILTGLGVPENAIVRVEPRVQDTFDELTRVRELAEQKGWKSLIILTSNYHTRRTRLVARYLLNPEIDFTVVGSPHGGLNRDAWWESRDNVRTFLIEFEKLVAYTLYIWPRMIL